MNDETTPTPLCHGFAGQLYESRQAALLSDAIANAAVELFDAAAQSSFEDLATDTRRIACRLLALCPGA